MLLDTPSYKKLFKHMIILNNSIKVEFFEGPKLVKDNLQKIEKSLERFPKRLSVQEVAFLVKPSLEALGCSLGAPA